MTKGIMSGCKENVDRPSQSSRTIRSPSVKNILHTGSNASQVFHPSSPCDKPRRLNVAHLLVHYELLLKKLFTVFTTPASETA